MRALPTAAAGTPVTRTLAPGVRLHVLSSPRFTTTLCRVALHRDLGPEATATAILASVLRAGTVRHASRQALARRLADLYGATLNLGVEKLGDRQLLVAGMEWPTVFASPRGHLLEQGLALLREVLTEPLRGEDGVSFCPSLVHTEQVNQIRALRALQDDKGRYAMRRALAAACAHEPFGLDVDGREEDVAGATPAVLAALHARLLATAPVEVFLAGDLTPAAAERAVRRHLLWAREPLLERAPTSARGLGVRSRRGSAGSPRRAAPAGAAPIFTPPPDSVRDARSRPRRDVEKQALSQGKLVLVLRAAIGPRHRLAPAASVLAGVLGGGPFGRLFKVVREVHGLCYSVGASWHEAKGLLVIPCGVDPKNEGRARRMILALVREVASGRLEPTALRGYREAVGHRVASLGDNRGAALGWAQQALALGLDPSAKRWLARLLCVTPAEVRAVGRRLRLDTVFFLGSTTAGRQK